MYIKVCTVCYSSSIFPTHQHVVICTYSRSRTSVIRGKDIQTFREYGMFLQRQCLWLYVIHCNVSQMRKRTSVRTEHMSVIWSCIKINGVVSREKKKTGGVSRPSHTLSSFSSDRSKTVPLFHYFFLCALVVSYVAFFCHYLRNKLFPTVLKWNAPDKA